MSSSQVSELKDQTCSSSSDEVNGFSLVVVWFFALVGMSRHSKMNSVPLMFAGLHSCCSGSLPSPDNRSVHLLNHVLGFSELCVTPADSSSHWAEPVHTPAELKLSSLLWFSSWAHGHRWRTTQSVSEKWNQNRKNLRSSINLLLCPTGLQFWSPFSSYSPNLSWRSVWPKPHPHAFQFNLLVRNDVQ